ncbi:hypothetical protein [Pseudosporangium ferrugineum]|uniref:Secreted protein n=1 Tax=Pseudosporangium ferrugineum TaxID=439699 RepID=A0A2T0SB45_9ACTN|nr:hypothetical protein [Pseudosporangium ferrugineum]PRY30638.1 hypothetical protein CLV70_104190 [Pseudosporangium ferrugineum]
MSVVRRLSAVLAVLLAVILPGPAPARAAYDWPPPICTEVEFEGLSVTQSSTSLHHWMISGYVRPCPGAADPQARWTVVRYQTRGLGEVGPAKPYQGDDERGFHFLFNRDLAPNFWAMCVVNDVQPAATDPALRTADRVACVAADPTGASPTASPVPVDDVRFFGALLTDETGGPRPGCASCV